MGHLPLQPRAWLAAAAGLGLLAAARAQTDSEQPSGPVVAATVNGRAVYVREVERIVARTVGRRQVEPAAEELLRATALQQLVDQQLILDWLAGQGRAATEADVQLAIGRLEQRLGEREVTLEAYLARRQMDRSALVRAMRWQLTWQRYLDRFLTDQNLQRYFEDHRRQFDGTELRVAHILFRDAPQEAGSQTEQALAAARQVRARIVAGEMSFGEAARQFSAAPTADSSGDIGWISRQGPMPESFSRAAFALEEGQLSQPVATEFGVHLIRCLEIRPGQKQWHEVRGRLEQAVTRYLFEWAAEQGREGSTVKFTGAVPHLAPGTDRVVSRSE